MYTSENQIILYYLKKIYKFPASGIFDYAPDCLFYRTMGYLKRICHFDISKMIKERPFLSEDKRYIANLERQRMVHRFFYDETNDENIPAVPDIPDITDYHFDKNFSLVADAFHVPTAARPLFQILFYALRYDSLNLLILNTFNIDLDDFDVNGDDMGVMVFDRLDGSILQEQLKDLLSPTGLFVRLGILTRGDTCTVRLGETFKKLVTMEFESVDDVNAARFGKRLVPCTTPDDFKPIQVDFNNVVRLLRGATHFPDCHLNILIYGASDVYRTEFVAAACAAAGLSAYLFPFCMSVDNTIPLLTHQDCELAKLGSAALVFNPADHMLWLAKESFRRERALRTLTQNNKTPIIWVAEKQENLSEHLNKFSLVVHLDDDTRNSKNRVIQTLMKKYDFQIQDADILQFLADADVPMACLDSAFRNAKIANDKGMITYSIKNFIRSCSKI